MTRKHVQFKSLCKELCHKGDKRGKKPIYEQQQHIVRAQNTYLISVLGFLSLKQILPVLLLSEISRLS